MAENKEIVELKDEQLEKVSGGVSYYDTPEEAIRQGKIRYPYGSHVEQKYANLFGHVLTHGGKVTNWKAVQGQVRWFCMYYVEMDGSGADGWYNGDNFE